MCGTIEFTFFGLGLTFCIFTFTFIMSQKGLLTILTISSLTPIVSEYTSGRLFLYYQYESSIIEKYNQVFTMLGL